MKEFQIIQCQGCEDISFRLEASNSSDYVEDEEGKPVYLTEEEIFPSRLMGRLGIDILDTIYLESSLRGIYKETNSALSSKMPVLATIGMRAIVEMVCKAQKAKGRNLEQKIDSLVDLHILTPKSAAVIHKIRMLGNSAAHDVTANELALLEVAMDVIEHLLRDLYIIPAKAEDNL